MANVMGELTELRCVHVERYPTLDLVHVDDR